MEKEGASHSSESSALLLSNGVAAHHKSIQEPDATELGVDKLPTPHHHEERKVTRLEMWIDALASIVVTLTILPLMEILNAPKEERILTIAFLLFSVVLGFSFMSLVMTNTYLAFNWFGDHHATDPVLYALGLLFLASLSLFAFAVQSLLEAYIDSSAVYFFGGTFIAIYASCFLLFLYCLRATDIRQKVARESAVNYEIAFFVCTIATLAVMMIVSTFVSSDYQSYVMYGVLAALLLTHRATRTEANFTALLPGGFPKERIDVFTDGVYAVAVTLFLIEIRYPAGVDAREAIALAFLKEEWRAVAGHFVSFAVLGVHWCLQNFIAAHIERVSRTMYDLTMIHCAAAALFPFTMKLALLCENPGWEVVAPLVIYFNLSLSQLGLWLRTRGTISDKLASWLTGGLISITVVLYVSYELFATFH